MPYQRMTKAQRSNRLNDWVTMHLLGHSYVEIAEQYNVRNQTVQAQVSAAIKARTNATIDEAREVMIAQCDHHIAIMGKAAEAGDHYASDTVRRWQDQRNKLLGAYAVTTSRVEFNPTTGTVDEEIAQLTASLAGNDAAHSSDPTTVQAADLHVQTPGPPTGPDPSLSVTADAPKRPGEHRKSTKTHDRE